MLSGIKSPISAAEAHGILAGLFCVHLDAECNQWLSVVLADGQVALTEPERVAFQRLQDVARSELIDQDFAFDLWLPDDDETLAVRTIALGEWCQGFLSGLGYQHGRGSWPGSCDDVIRDLAAIANVESAPDADEAAEEAFTEVVEYIRAGVLLIRSELDDSDSGGQIH